MRKKKIERDTDEMNKEKSPDGIEGCVQIHFPNELAIFKLHLLMNWNLGTSRKKGLLSYGFFVFFISR